MTARKKGITITVIIAALSVLGFILYPKLSQKDPELEQLDSETFTLETPFSKFKDTSDVLPNPLGYVNDFEEVFTAQQKENLERRLIEYEARTNKEIAIVTVHSIETYNSLEEYAIDLSNYWGVGKKGLNNGLSIVFSNSLREIRISTGLGTEKILTDSICQRVIAENILPEFEQLNFYKGINDGLTTLMVIWDNAN